MQEANVELEADVGKLRKQAAELEQRTFAVRVELQVQVSKLASEKQDLEQRSTAQIESLTASNAQQSKQLADHHAQVARRICRSHCCWLPIALQQLAPSAVSCCHGNRPPQEWSLPAGLY